ncbi:unnamed protein product [Soboliphyme baturini]|uniref:MBL fold metallo-hydrolase n=1 Tax=Soboliphyme baturini TaxID=241478 RepID=A0A183JAS6_9BILA|nr:unnamed protein product [Soboliphyme baturini]
MDSWIELNALGSDDSGSSVTLCTDPGLLIDAQRSYCSSHRDSRQR